MDLQSASGDLFRLVTDRYWFIHSDSLSLNQTDYQIDAGLLLSTIRTAICLTLVTKLSVALQWSLHYGESSLLSIELGRRLPNRLWKVWLQIEASNSRGDREMLGIRKSMSKSAFPGRKRQQCCEVLVMERPASGYQQNDPKAQKREPKTVAYRSYALGSTKLTELRRKKGSKCAPQTCRAFGCAKCISFNVNSLQSIAKEKEQKMQWPPGLLELLERWTGEHLWR